MFILSSAVKESLHSFISGQKSLHSFITVKENFTLSSAVKESLHSFISGQRKSSFFHQRSKKVGVDGRYLRPVVVGKGSDHQGAGDGEGGVNAGRCVLVSRLCAGDSFSAHLTSLCCTGIVLRNSTGNLERFKITLLPHQRN